MSKRDIKVLVIVGIISLLYLALILLPPIWIHPPLKVDHAIEVRIVP